jgi:hypothetical protein
LATVRLGASPVGTVVITLILIIAVLNAYARHTNRHLRDGRISESDSRCTNGI